MRGHLLSLRKENPLNLRWTLLRPVFQRTTLHHSESISLPLQFTYFCRWTNILNKYIFFRHFIFANHNIVEWKHFLSNNKSTLKMLTQVVTQLITVQLRPPFGPPSKRSTWYAPNLSELGRLIRFTSNLRGMLLRTHRIQFLTRKSIVTFSSSVVK